MYKSQELDRMSILVLTGQMAYEIVKEYIKPFINSVNLMKLPISIAAFATPDLIIKHLQGLDLSSYKTIIVPGLMQGSTQRIEDRLNIPTFKGPRYASDLPLILEDLPQLSKTIPADKLFIDRGIEEYKNIVERKKKQIPSHKYYEIGSNIIGIDFPPLILAEIVDAPKYPLPKIISQCDYYLKNGAQILDIGAIVGQNNAKTLGIIIEEIKSRFQVPISIDSLTPEEIEVGVEAGADLVLSLDAGNIEELKNLPKDRVFTIIPTNTKEGLFPKSPEKRVDLLFENITKAVQLGFKQILIDPLLESPISPGLVKSLDTCIQFRKKEPNWPVLFGAGNVSELIDADSIGINAILACIAVELGVSVILTTEYSNKTRKTVEELSIAIKLAYFANEKKRPPSGLPFNLLRAKNKKRYDEMLDERPDTSIIVQESNEAYNSDPNGYFKIWIDPMTQLISILHYQNSVPRILITGPSAEPLGKKILTLNLTQDPSHILYLGRELERAEIALFLGKDYIQDIRFEEVH